MTQTVEDYLNEVPCPPPLAKGEKKPLTITLSPEEYDIVQMMAHHPAFKEMYKGLLYQPIRHLIYHFAWDMAGQAEGEWQMPLVALKQGITTYNLEITREGVNDVFDKYAHSCNLLMDFGESAGALTELTKLLTEIAKMPVWWQRVMRGLMDNHLGMKEFIGRYVSNSQFGAQEMQAAWETTLGA